MGGSYCKFIALFIVYVIAAGPASAADSLENEFLTLRWDAPSQTLQVIQKGTARIVAENIELLGGTQEPRVSEVTHTVFGDGQQYVFDQDPQAETFCQVFPRLPFVLVKVKLRNPTSDERTINRLTVATCDSGWTIPPHDLTTFGTGGLYPIDENPGSYAWLALVEPSNRNGLVMGWLTHDRASGVMFSRLEDNRPLLEARLDYGRLVVRPGETTELETLAVGFFADARLGLEAWADAVAKTYQIKLPPQPTGYCTWYSQPHGGASDESHLVELAEFAAEQLAPYGFAFVQIDDKWQAGESTNGPKRNFSTHAADGPYPSGMDAVAGKLSRLGLTPGIWFMPFAGTSYDPYYSDKQHWFVKDKEGKPFETRWGGTCLDMTHPEAREHLRSLVDQMANDWGYSYFKIDGLWTGTGTPIRYVNSGYEEDGLGETSFHDPGKTPIEAYREGLRVVRETAGERSFILGCNGPQNMRSYGGAIGFVDAMRVGPDNGPQWEKLKRGPTFGSRHYFTHRRLWYNDPDPVYVRESVPLSQAQLICSWVAMSGQLNVSSDWLPGLPPERLEILKRCMPSHQLCARPVDLFTENLPSVWELHDPLDPDRSLIALFNWQTNPQSLGDTFANLGLDETKAYAAFDYWNDELISPLKNGLELFVPATSCRLLAVRPQSERPQLISTSRHVTQGIVDVLESQWDEKTFSLQGQSVCVAGDPYELRILLPSSEWRPNDFHVVQNNSGLPAESITQEGQLLRIGFHPRVSGIVEWSIEFGQHKLEAQRALRK